MRGRLLVIVGIVLVLVVVLAVVFLGSGLLNPQDPNTTPGTVQLTEDIGTDTEIGPTPTPIRTVKVVVAVQELPRGFRIPANAVDIREWPEAAAPFQGIDSIEVVVGKIARTDILREQPILTNMLVDDFQNLANTIGRTGSDAAAILPPSLVAIAMPVDRLTSVAYAIQPGDRVDVIVSMLFVDVDEAFQTIAPNEYVLIREVTDGLFISEPIIGRPDQITLGNVIIKPSERQRPRLLTQRTIQDALVVHVGEFPVDARLFGSPLTPTAIVEEAPLEETPVEDTGADGEPLPTPTENRPDVVTLGVTPQEAVLMVWAIESRLPLTLALRSATDTNRVPTEAVTLDFFMSEYRITVPGKREYTIEPAIVTIRQLDLQSSQVSLAPNADTGDN